MYDFVFRHVQEIIYLRYGSIASTGSLQHDLRSNLLRVETGSVPLE